MIQLPAQFTWSSAWMLYRWTAVVLTPVLACLLIACSLGKAAETKRADRAEAARDRALKDLGTCRGNVMALDAAVARQNAAVSAWEAEAARISREGLKAVSDARAAAESERRRADRALAAKPKSCADLSGVLERSLP